jgi:CxxC motif-containing protein
MIKKMICIECPTGCELSVDVQNGKAVEVEGHKCPKGEKYAVSEIENPRRILTTSVLAEGLSLKMVPVRTSLPISKSLLFEAMEEVKKMRVTTRLKAGDTVAKNFLNTGADLITTREVPD